MGVACWDAVESVGVLPLLLVVELLCDARWAERYSCCVRVSRSRWLAGAIFIACARLVIAASNRLHKKKD